MASTGAWRAASQQGKAALSCAQARPEFTSLVFCERSVAIRESRIGSLSTRQGRAPYRRRRRAWMSSSLFKERSIFLVSGFWSLVSGFWFLVSRCKREKCYQRREAHDSSRFILCSLDCALRATKLRT